MRGGWKCEGKERGSDLRSSRRRATKRAKGAAKPSGAGVTAAVCEVWVIDGSPPGTAGRLPNEHELPSDARRSGEEVSYRKGAARPIRAKSRARAKSPP